jgi:mono/diheme cytochrome c family protein
MKYFVLLACGWGLLAQQPPAPAKPVVRRPSAFPERAPADPAKVDRGKAIYGVNCTFCHGADARGGSGGTNLIRASIVMSDRDGELIHTVLKEGREGMPKFNFTAEQASDIAAFIHSFKVGGYDVSRMTPPSIVTGDAKQGEAYFQKTCAKCHSVTGDLKAIGSRIDDAKLLQQTWLMPGSGGARAATLGLKVPPVTVDITTADGKKLGGRLERVDDFLVSWFDSNNVRHTLSRDGDTPKVVINEPLAPHKALLRTYRDEDIHNLTAYLVTVK